MSRVKQKVIEAIDELSEVEYRMQELKDLTEDSEFCDLLSPELQEAFTEMLQSIQEELEKGLTHLEAVVNKYLD